MQKVLAKGICERYLRKVCGRMTLDKIKIGESAVITRVGGEGPLRLRLLDMGLIPRTEVTLIKTAPLGDPMEFRLRGYELTLRREDAACIEVAVVAVRQAAAESGTEQKADRSEKSAGSSTKHAGGAKRTENSGSCSKHAGAAEETGNNGSCSKSIGAAEETENDAPSSDSASASQKGGRGGRKGRGRR